MPQYLFITFTIKIQISPVPSWWHSLTVSPGLGCGPPADVSQCPLQPLRPFRADFLLCAPVVLALLFGITFCLLLGSNILRAGSYIYLFVLFSTSEDWSRVGIFLPCAQLEEFLHNSLWSGVCMIISYKCLLEQKGKNNLIWDWISCLGHLDGKQVLSSTSFRKSCLTYHFQPKCFPGHFRHSRVWIWK